MKKRSIIVSAFSQDANLKRKIRAHLRKIGFTKAPDGSLVPPMATKETIRAIHQTQRNDKIKSQQEFIASKVPALEKYFANGDEVQPEEVRPRLELIDADTWQSDLFRLASLSWSVPVSAGFGRRLRYLVWDDNNEKLIGIMALGDPVFNLKARDDLIGWNAAGRGRRLVNVMDAYVLGAIPPYNLLLAGKLVASLIRTKEVRDDFSRKYGATRGIISKKRKHARLLMVTTTSSLGRSSIYNRVKLGKQSYLRPIGYTSGWGHFHVPDTLFSDIRSYLRKLKHRYTDAHKFGAGPNWRLRTIRAAFDALGFKADLLKHGIKREVFVCELAANAQKILRGSSVRAVYRGLKTVEEVGILARERWLVPRAERCPEYKNWKRREFIALLVARQLARPTSEENTNEVEVKRIG